MKPRLRRSFRVNIRLRGDEHHVLGRAAEKAKKSISAFVREAAIRSASHYSARATDAQKQLSDSPVNE